MAVEQPLLDLVVDPSEFSPDSVHLVDETDTRDAVLGRLTPHCLALRLDPFDSRKDDDGPVQHAQRSFHFRGEVNVPGGIDDVDRDRPAVGILPVAGDRRGDDRDPALALLLQVIGRRVSLVNVPHPVDLASVIENPLGRGCLAGVDMGNDADVADEREIRM